MDPYRFGEPRVRKEVFLAFIVGVALVYVLGELGVRWYLGGGFIGQLLSPATIIPAVVGGAWYHWRKIL